MATTLRILFLIVFLPFILLGAIFYLARTAFMVGSHDCKFYLREMGAPVDHLP